MNLRTLFPRLSAYPGSPLSWDLELTTPEMVGSASTMVTAQMQNACGPDTTLLLRVSVAARDDILDARGSGLLPARLGDFLQLWVSAHPAHHGIGTGRFVLTHDWLIAALNDQPVGTRDVELRLERLPGLVREQLPGSASLNVVPAVLMWLGDLFYYVRNQGALRDVARAAFGFAVSFVPGCEPQDSVEALSHIAAWARAESEPAGRACVDRLLQWYRNDEVPPELQKTIAVLFSTDVGNLTGQALEYWAQLALTRHAGHLAGHERLQVLTTALRNEPIQRIRDRWPEVRQALMEHRAQFQGGAQDSYGAGRLFRVVLPLFNALLPAGVSDLAMDLLAELRRTPVTEARRPGPDLVVAPNYRTGTVYAGNGASTIHASDTTHSEVIRVLNAGLGTALNVEDDPEFVLENPPRGLGVPTLALGAELEMVVGGRLFGPDVVPILSAPPFDSCRGMVDISGLPLPWQAFTLRAFRRAWPIVRSFEAPAGDRPIRRALYWSAGRGGTFTSALEERVLRDVLGDRLIVLSGDEHGRERFLHEYSRPDLDLLWVDGHGDYDHYEPHAAGLRVSADEIVRVEDLLGQAVGGGDQRRLVVFNVCDGAATAALNAPGEVGLASLLAGSRQAVISHLCPVDPRVALFFGALLVRSLGAGTSFFDSFSGALAAMLGGRERIRAELAHHAELVETLDRCDLHLSNILEVGTPEFLE
jgi:hypothetical protein